MQAPSIAAMPAELRDAAVAVARALRAGGAQAWLVGGAVRDLALGRAPKDVDLATDATPERVEQLFPDSKGVGRAFGTMLVFEAGTVVQVTTFRSERGYSDARRPDHVEFGASPEEDARRRDFTCNAMFLDPLDDSLLDPEGGLADLAARRLACVGDPVERFREDGLRLLRLARFAADLDLHVAPATLAGARASVASISGVSGERVHAELTTIFTRPRAARALALLHEIGVLERALPEVPCESVPARCRIAARCSDPLGVLEGLAILLADTVLDPRTQVAPEVLERRLARLKPSGEQRSGLREVAELVVELDRWRTAAPSRSELARAVRRDSFGAGVRVASAAFAELGLDVRALEAPLALAQAFGPGDLQPRPLLTSDDLAAAGVPRGPRWKELLLEAETAQLDLALRTREEALAWLRQRAAGS